MKTNYLKLSTLALAGIIAFSSCKKVESKFTVNNPTAWVGEAVTIKDGVDAKLKKTSYSYDFGDGTQTEAASLTAGVKSPSHVYTKAGKYTITQQVSKPGMLGKTPKKSAESTQDVTIQMVTPALSVSNDAPNSGEVVTITNTTDESSNKGYAPSYVVSVSGPTGVSNLSSNDGMHFAFTPTSSGSYIITLVAMQGDSKGSVSKTITVGGNASQQLTSMLAGTWSIDVAASFSGYICNSPALQGSTYSSISINSSGTIYTAVQKLPASSAGNIATGVGSISVLDNGLVNISASLLTITANNLSSSYTGVYSVTSSTQSKIVLTRTEKGSDIWFCSGSNQSGSYNDVYTITLTR